MTMEVAMTLKDFLALPFTSDFHLLNSIPDIANIPVEYISILEPPVENFVRTNEIVLSTALSVRDKPEELYNLSMVFMNPVQLLWFLHSPIMIFRNWIPNCHYLRNSVFQLYPCRGIIFFPML